jgi:hypothetical protein
MGVWSWPRTETLIITMEIPFQLWAKEAHSKTEAVALCSASMLHKIRRKSTFPVENGETSPWRTGS